MTLSWQYLGRRLAVLCTIRIRPAADSMTPWRLYAEQPPQRRRLFARRPVADPPPDVPAADDLIVSTIKREGAYWP